MSVSIYEAALGSYHPDKTVEEQLCLAYANLAGKPPEETDFAEQYPLLQNPPEKFNDDAADAYVALHSLKALISGDNNQEHPLVGWPTYQYMIDVYGKRVDHSSALLLGSASSLSSRGFTTLAKEELGADEAHVIDLHGGAQKASEGIFTTGSVLELPRHYPASSKDYIITSQLFHQLVFPERLGYGNAIEQVLDGAYQVLKPGGQLLLKECLPEARYNQPVATVEAETHSLGRYLRQLLTAIGFAKVRSHQPANHADSAVFDPTRNFDKHINGRSFGVVAVHAQKA